MPASVAVPFPLSTNVTPEGRLPVSLSVGLGNPVVVTRKLPGAPAAKVVPPAKAAPPPKAEALLRDVYISY